MEIFTNPSWITYAAGAACITVFLVAIASVMQNGTQGVAPAVLLVLVAAFLGYIAAEDYVGGWSVGPNGLAEVHFLHGGTEVKWHDVADVNYEHYRYEDASGVQKAAEAVIVVQATGGRTVIDVTDWADADVRRLSSAITANAPRSGSTMKSSLHVMAKQMASRSMTTSVVKEM